MRCSRGEVYGTLQVRSLYSLDNTAYRRENPMIYFVREGTKGPIKIGSTNGLLSTRINTLQTSNSRTLTCIATMDGTLATERVLREQFKVHWMRGEWFRPVPALIRFIQEHGRRYPSLCPYRTKRTANA